MFFVKTLFLAGKIAIEKKKTPVLSGQSATSWSWYWDPRSLAPGNPLIEGGWKVGALKAPCSFELSNTYYIRLNTNIDTKGYIINVHV